MAASSTAIASLPVRRPNLVVICAKEAKYEFLKNLRFPMYSVSTLVFPLMFYVLFGLVMGKQMIGHVTTTLYLIPAYGTFGVMGASLFGTAAGLASERGLGWLQVKRASPMPSVRVFPGKGDYEPDLQHHRCHRADADGHCIRRSASSPRRLRPSCWGRWSPARFLSARWVWRLAILPARTPRRRSSTSSICQCRSAPGCGCPLCSCHTSCRRLH